ncbi:hypothetical protein Tco_0136505 [Tanacetum coccineum]
MQCLSPKSTGFNEFSSNITTAIVCLATNSLSFSGRTIQLFESKLVPYDETASPTRDDKHGEAFLTATSLDAGHDRENIAKTSGMPHKASPGVNSLSGGKGSMQQKLQELMDMCTNLQQQHLLMEQRI